LHRESAGREPYEIHATLNDDAVSTILTYGARLTVSGGAAPWTGRQHFSLSLADEAAPKSVEIPADVTLPPGVVIAVKSLPAGSIIHEGDVIVKSAAGVNTALQVFRRIDDVVGRETTWSIPAGTVLTADGIRRPVIVRRGQPVTLYARSEGLRVRTTVRAREDGAVGDLITVESLTAREPFYARVTGVQEAEVYAAPAEAVAPQPATTALSDKAAPGGTAR
jgi:flagella basal body P-ring formation protein FlgA